MNKENRKSGTEPGKGAHHRKIASIFLLPCFLLSLFVFSSCSVRQQTVVPRAIVSTEASFDGNVQNSGIIKYDEHGFIVSAHWLERYDAMLARFGDKLFPAIKPGDRIGIDSLPPSSAVASAKEDLNYRVSQQVMVRFTRMNQWRKAEQGP
jgi:hypothetical protein